MTPPPLRIALAAACLGGILGSLARYGITEAFEPGLDFPWAVFAINVAGSGLLAALPLLRTVRRTPWLTVFLGTGVLGGFTTMSTASEQTVVLFENDRTGLAIAYAGGTLVCALAAAWLVSRAVAVPDRDVTEAAE